MNPAGLGSKLYFCRKEDFEKAPAPLPMQEVKLEPVKIGDIGLNEEAHYFPKGFSFTGSATLIGTATEKDSWLKALNSDRANMVVVPDERRLPRKMKKGFRSKYQRNTKWKRKAALWLARNQMTLTGSLRVEGEKMTSEGVQRVICEICVRNDYRTC